MCVHTSAINVFICEHIILEIEICEVYIGYSYLTEQS